MEAPMEMGATRREGRTGTSPRTGWSERKARPSRTPRLVGVGLLPHLDAVDDHAAAILPGGQPLIPRVPEVLLGAGAEVHPRLAAGTVLEPAVGAADGDVEDEVEVVIERRLEPARLAPRVHQSGPVGVRQGKVAPLPERLVEVGVEHLQEAGVDVGEEVLLAPLEPEGVEALGVGRVQRPPLDVGPPPGVVGRVGSPVQGAADDVVAALPVRVVVPARLDDVDLARERPRPVRVRDRQHPDGRPEPVARRQLGPHLDAAVGNGRALLRVDASGADGVEDGSIGDVGARHAVGEHLGRADALGRQIQDVVGRQELLILQGGHDHQLPVLDEDVLLSVGGLLELAIPAVSVSTSSTGRVVRRESGGVCAPESTDFDLLRPNGLVEPLAEVFVQDEFILVGHHRPQAIPHQETRQEQAHNQAQDGNDGDPLLLRILLAQPRPLDLALSYSTRAEVTRGGWVPKGR